MGKFGKKITPLPPKKPQPPPEPQVQPPTPMMVAYTDPAFTQLYKGLVDQMKQAFDRGGARDFFEFIESVGVQLKVARLRNLYETEDETELNAMMDQAVVEFAIFIDEMSPKVSRAISRNSVTLKFIKRELDLLKMNAQKRLLREGEQNGQEDAQSYREDEGSRKSGQRQSSW